MNQIVNLIDRREFVDTVIAWIQYAWPHGNRDRFYVEDRLCGDYTPGKLPQALVLLDDHQKPLGFISMVFHLESAQKGRPYWIDALYIDVPMRRRGLGSILLRRAEEKAASMNLARLHALTEIPAIYEKSGWTLLERVGGSNPLDVIMTKTLKPPAPSPP